MAEVLDLNKLGKSGRVNNYLRRRWAETHNGGDPVTSAQAHEHDWLYLMASAMVFGLTAISLPLIWSQPASGLIMIGVVSGTLVVGLWSAISCIVHLWFLVLLTVRIPFYLRFTELLAQVAEYWEVSIEDFADWPAEKLQEQVTATLLALAAKQLRLQRDQPGRYYLINDARSNFQEAYDTFRELRLANTIEEYYHERALDEIRLAKGEETGSKPGEQEPGTNPPPLGSHS